jgi:hypothetical protein
MVKHLFIVCKRVPFALRVRKFLEHRERVHNEDTADFSLWGICSGSSTRKSCSQNLVWCYYCNFRASGTYDVKLGT